jgi:hypothetical protein
VVGSLRRYVAYAFCATGMIGVYFLVRFAIFDISADFGHGFFIGIATMVLLFWAAERVRHKA